MAEAPLSGLPRIGEIPDSGPDREGLCLLCVRTREVMRSRAVQALRSGLHECDHLAAERRHGVVRPGLQEPAQRLIRKHVPPSTEREEVRPDAAAPFVVDVVPAMLLHRPRVCDGE
ncbi:TetR/AcrR family transcriptional regulator C-terminal ligand-binding domain-containing protein [Streptomyces sp. NRRL F-2664]|uniref:TetR/AcrR family transcriptional regulator C-terminal ligand-binding domain-containing protein n=1 Tax=Streptomyces sp. NRRL F-2664 TaxID=1463842 RepID=UPI001F20A226|nr:TetR/AcrR family transcriptional regulator C-terminal ligand-binding domain-containing protein [Streptomyces sp. NRRL F-2664]